MRSLGFRLRRAAAAATVQRHQPAQFDVEGAFFLYLPAVEAALAQGLALVFLGGGGTLEVEDIGNNGRLRGFTIYIRNGCPWFIVLL